jgi:hypothetical protein
MRESDGVEMLEVRPFAFVSANYINGTDIFGETESEHVMHPNNVELHRIAAQVREYNRIHGLYQDEAI